MICNCSHDEDEHASEEEVALDEEFSRKVLGPSYCPDRPCKKCDCDDLDFSDGWAYETLYGGIW